MRIPHQKRNRSIYTLYQKRIYLYDFIKMGFLYKKPEMLIKKIFFDVKNF